MSMGEWIVELDADLQITQIMQRTDVDPDPRNGPLGAFANVQAWLQARA